MFNSTDYDELALKVALEWGGINYYEKRRLLHVLCSLTSLISIIGSGYIIYDMVFKRRREIRTKLSKTFYELLVGLSVADLVGSISMFFSTWAMPQDSVDSWFFWGSIGNELTCQLQGFFLCWGWGSAVYFTACISIQFVLVVKFQFTKQTLQKIRPIFFLVSIVLPFIGALRFLMQDMYHPAGNFCYVSQYPYFCPWIKEDENLIDASTTTMNTTRTRMTMEECLIRGKDNSKSIGFQSYFIFMFIIFIILISCMVTLYMTVRQQEQRVHRHQPYSFDNVAIRPNNNIDPSSSRRSRQFRKSQKIANRAYLFFASFMIVNGPALIGSLFFNSWIAGLSIVLTLPLQGFFNALIYSHKLDTLIEVFQKKRSRIQRRISYDFTSGHWNSAATSRGTRAALPEAAAAAAGPRDSSTNYHVETEATTSSTHRTSSSFFMQFSSRSLRLQHCNFLLLWRRNDPLESACHPSGTTTNENPSTASQNNNPTHHSSAGVCEAIENNMVGIKVETDDTASITCTNNEEYSRILSLEESRAIVLGGENSIVANEETHKQEEQPEVNDNNTCCKLETKSLHSNYDDTSSGNEDYC